MIVFEIGNSGLNSYERKSKIEKSTSHCENRWTMMFMNPRMRVQKSHD